MYVEQGSGRRRRDKATVTPPRPPAPRPDLALGKHRPNHADKAPDAHATRTRAHTCLIPLAYRFGPTRTFEVLKTGDSGGQEGRERGSGREAATDSPR